MFFIIESNTKGSWVIIWLHIATGKCWGMKLREPHHLCWALRPFWAANSIARMLRALSAPGQHPLQQKACHVSLREVNASMLKPDTEELFAFFFFFSQQPIKQFENIPVELNDNIVWSNFAGILTRAEGQPHRYTHCAFYGMNTVKSSSLLSICLICFMHNFSSLFRRPLGVRRRIIILLWYIINNTVCILFMIKSLPCCLSASFLLQVQPSQQVTFWLPF